MIALNASHPRISQVSFAFNLNLPMQVRITLAKRVRAHRHTRWQAIRSSLTFTAKSGANSQRLKGSGKLGPGTYRLTVQVPDNFYQIDLVAGAEIDHFGPAGGNVFYSAQSRLLSADNGGSGAPYVRVAGTAVTVNGALPIVRLAPIRLGKS